MASAGDSHTLLLRSDGKVTIAGSHAMGPYNLAALQKRGPFKQVSAGGEHSLLLTVKGDVVALGSNDDGQCSLPDPRAVNKDLKYVQVSAGHKHSAALRSDGEVVCAGINHCDDTFDPEVGGEIDLSPVDPSLPVPAENISETLDDDMGYDGEILEIPVLPLSRFCNDYVLGEGRPGAARNPARLSNAFDVSVKTDVDMQPPHDPSKASAIAPRCVQVSAGHSHTTLLHSDGRVYAFGKNESGQCLVPKDAGYIQVSAGGSHTVLLHQSGEAKAIGSNGYRQCDVPKGEQYVRVSAGSSHTVLLRSDGHVDALGCNKEGQCEIPPLEGNLTYLQASAGGNHTVLLRSDGQAFTVGTEGDISIPAVSQFQTWADWFKTKPILPEGVSYVPDMGDAPVPDHQMQAMPKKPRTR